jgi:uncharacterized coiled-coil protein SlyX
MNNEQYRERFIDELNEQIWRKKVNLEFDRSKVPAVVKLQEDKFKELDALKEELKAIDPKDTTKVTRMKRKEVEGKIAKAEEFIVSCDETVSMINDSVRKDEEKMSGLKERVEFAKTFTYEDHAINKD